MAKIGIVILNYKTYLDTERLVKKITSEECNHNLFIQVVDNASPNESYEYLSRNLRQENVNVYLNDSNSGFAKGNNVGLRLLKTFNPEYVLILNNDIYFDNSLFAKLIKTYESINGCGIIAPIQKLPNGKNERFYSLDMPTFGMDLRSYTLFLSRKKNYWEYKENTQYSNIQETPIIPGCFIFIDYKLFESIGFFDESTFLFCEERFLAKKLYDIGKKNYILLDCSYIHDHSKTIKQEVSNLNQKRLIRDGHIAYTRKHRSLPLIKTILIRIAWQYYKTNFYAKFFIKKVLK